jgi:DNA processing protein
MTEQIYFSFWPCKVEGVSDIMAKKLLTHWVLCRAVFKTAQLAIDGVGSILLRSLKDKSVFEKASRELEFIKSNGINAVCFQDEKYPDRLKHCIDGPLLLFTSGNIDLKTNNQHCGYSSNNFLRNRVL